MNGGRRLFSNNHLSFCKIRKTGCCVKNCAQESCRRRQCQSANNTDSLTARFQMYHIYVSLCSPSYPGSLFSISSRCLVLIPSIAPDIIRKRRYNLLRHSLLAPFRAACGSFILPAPANYVSLFLFFNMRNLLFLTLLWGHCPYIVK